MSLFSDFNEDCTTKKLLHCVIHRLYSYLKVEITVTRVEPIMAININQTTTLVTFENVLVFFFSIIIHILCLFIVYNLLTKSAIQN